jgi:hypothetical protein
VAAVRDFSHRASLPSASLPSYPVTLTKRKKQFAELEGIPDWKIHAALIEVEAVDLGPEPTSVVDSRLT